MIFDKFCGAVERWLPKYTDVTKEAKIFVFETRAVMPTVYKEDVDTFTLPFFSTAIEGDSASVLMYDTDTDQVGLRCKRGFIVSIPIFDTRKEFYLDIFDDEEEHPSFHTYRENLLSLGFDKDTQLVIDGDFTEGDEAETELRLSLDIKGHYHCGKRFTNLRDICYDDEAKNLVYSLALRCLGRAVNRVFQINAKKNFVLETSPKNPQISSKKIPRGHQRPLYSVLDARTIRAKMGTLDSHDKTLANGRLRNSPIPHERRRHPRRLSADGGHFKEDRVIIIPACWIGESEKVVGNKIYKVRLDI